jgi:hypothetical protein
MTQSVRSFLLLGSVAVLKKRKKKEKKEKRRKERKK